MANILGNSPEEDRQGWLQRGLEHARGFARKFPHPELGRRREAGAFGAETGHHHLHLRSQYAREKIWRDSQPQQIIKKLAQDYKQQFAECNKVVIMGTGILSEANKEGRPGPTVNNSDVIVIQIEMGQEFAHGCDSARGAGEGSTKVEVQEPALKDKKDDEEWLHDHSILWREKGVENDIDDKAIVIEFVGGNASQKQMIRTKHPRIAVLSFELDQELRRPYTQAHKFSFPNPEGKQQDTLWAAMEDQYVYIRTGN
ncbi:MAG: hypothetical protein Q9162_006269 [Coniocarpon cinnabarinum]